MIDKVKSWENKEKSIVYEVEFVFEEKYFIIKI